MICLGVPEETHWPDNVSCHEPATIAYDCVLMMPILVFYLQWTAVTVDGKRSAQFEETLLVTETGVEILTAAPKKAVHQNGNGDEAVQEVTEKVAENGISVS